MLPKLSISIRLFASKNLAVGDDVLGVPREQAILTMVRDVREAVPYKQAVISMYSTIIRHKNLKVLFDTFSFKKSYFRRAY